MSIVKPEEAPAAAVPTTEPAPPAATAAPPAAATAPATTAGPSGGVVGGGAGGANSFHSASLYVGDLLNEVNEGLLFEIFNAVGPVASIRVCRDAVTRRSLGYAYVNYHQVADAERALDSMNFTDIKGKPCRIMWSQRDPAVRRSGVGNIFVKNLHEGIDNKQLYDTFSLFGNILSCKVVIDKETGLSKGYGYVHYESGESARSAIEKLDGMLIDGKEVQVGAFMRRDNRPDAQAFTNVFIKNIPLEWDERKLESEFEQHGVIISVSISMGRRKRIPKKVKPVEKKEEEPVKKEEEGEAEKKEGEDEKPAEETSDKSKEEEPATKEEPTKEDDPAKEEEPAKDEEPAAPVVPKGPESLGFGFVNFADHEGAIAAVNAMNNKEYEVTEDGETFQKVLYVGRAQKKAERERELRAKYETEKMDRIAKFQGVNLYVKNLDDGVTDDVLRDEFSGMGTITSARVMRDSKTGVSRGFGFVCFSTPEDSTRAVNEMNGKIVSGKPIYVSLAQRREVRRAQLEAQHGQGQGGRGQGGPQGPGGAGGPGQPGMMRGPMGGPMGGYPGAVPMYMPRPGGPGGMQPSYPVGVPQMMGGGRGAYAGAMQGGPGGRPGYPMQGYGMMPTQPGRGGRGPQTGRGRGPPGRGGPMPYGRGRGGPAGPGQPPIKFNQQARNAQGPGGPPQGGPGMPTGPGGPMPPQPTQPADAGTQQVTGGPPGSEPAAPSQLTPAALASASPEVQKNMIGERLYPLIHNTQPELAGKITGMLLEMDNSELLHLLESPEALGSKIQEALHVLEAHQAGGVEK
eukprot:CAMPEP_0181093272 /NCGR_PEP_ID=MMETSP1071-20121207/9357_1 /TAXON_ID=35127 /ORGANISM="Thalassiosira sp., Strain NH16" /LENGTH=796 /DNA_ID=CAMNT_0023175495 /DNA_START=180 /DNA_END=2570 /DNA_ORIENTATION=+